LTESPKPVAIIAEEAPLRSKRSVYPEPFASRIIGREKKLLGDLFSLSNFGVNLTRLAPGALSALRHTHSLQDEFIYILEGTPTLIMDDGETQLHSGMCAGFKSGAENGHQLMNRSNADVVYLEIGDRTAGDTVTYPDHDLQATLISGNWQFSHKDGTPYPNT